METIGQVCPFHAEPEAQLCHDCGIAVWHQEEGDRMVHEDFYVHNEIWDTACPDDPVVEWVEDGETFRAGTFLLCIGCLEQRLGRGLTREDFEAPPRRQFGVPPSYRFRRRWKAGVR